MPCVADEIAATAGLVMLKTAGIPAAIVRGYPYEPGEGSASEIVRPRRWTSSRSTWCPQRA